MAYGTVKVDNITFTNGGIDQTVTVSGIVQSISGNITATGTIQAATIIGTSTVSGATVTGNAGVFTTVTGGSAGFTTVTGTTVTGTTANFATISGTTITGSVGNFGSGSAAAPSVSVGTTDNGIYSPGADQLALSTNGTGRLFVDASGNVGFNATPEASTGRTVLTSNGTSGNEIRLNTNGTQSLALITASGIGIIRAPEATGYLRFDTGGTTERLRITSAGLVGIGTSAPAAILSSKPSASSTTAATTFTGDGLFIDCANTTDGNGNYGGAISWSRSGSSTTRAAAITNVQTGSDSDVQGLAFLTHASTTSTAPLIEAMRITGAGLVGIGTASAGSLLSLKPSSGGGLEIQDTGGTARAFATLTGNPDFAAKIKTSNYYLDLEAVQASGGQGHIRFFTGVTTASERAAIDSSGRLLVGTSSARSAWSNSSVGSNLLQVERAGDALDASISICANSGTTSPTISAAVLYLGKTRGTTVGSTTAVAAQDCLSRVSFQGSDGTEQVEAAKIEAFVDGTPGANDMPGRLVFSTTADGASSPTERMRIRQGGDVLINRTSSGAGITNGCKLQVAADGGDWIAHFDHQTTTGANCYGVLINYTGASPNGTGNAFLNCSDTTTQRAAIRSNGGLANYSANDVNLSDINTKKDITPAADTWNCIKEWEIVNFRYKDQPDDADLNLGVIAQQVAESCPEVITVFEEAKDDQPEKLGVKEQQMYWMAIKALQEAQIRIETLEASNADLLARVTALESA